MDIARAAGALLLVGGLLALLLTAIRRGGWPGAAGTARRLRRLEQLPLTPHCSLQLVECEDRRLLLALTKDGVAVLRDTPAEQPSPAAQAAHS